MDMWIKVFYEMSANAILPTTAAFAIAAIGLNVHFGFTGLLNMGQAGFMLIGAYAYAVSTIAGFPFWAATLVTIGCGTLFALLLGIPTLKLRGDYLAIVTIAAAEIVRMIGRASILNDVTGGSNGLPGETYRNTFSALSPFPEGETAILWFDFDNTGLDYSHAEDIAGLIGQYIHGNEPSHHTGYMYVYAGAPWRTQARLTQIVTSQYHARPDGLAGNDDVGLARPAVPFSGEGQRAQDLPARGVGHVQRQAAIGVAAGEGVHPVPALATRHHVRRRRRHRIAFQFHEAASLG